MVYKAYLETKIGIIEIIEQNQHLVKINFVSKKQKSDNSKFLDLCQKQILEYLSGKRKYFDLKFLLQGTSFQQRVWDETLKIGYGQTATYKEIAQRIGKPKATRAVGTALGNNPVPIIIPCHRVIASSGKLGGYSNGLAIKKKLLELEKTHLISESINNLPNN